jgi:sulfonate transport system permease protein
MGICAPIFGVLLLPVLWLIVADWGHFVSPLLLPSFTDVLTRLWEMLRDGELLPDLLATLQRFAIGFSLGAICGILGGLILGVSNTLYRMFELPIEFFRSLPVTAIFPLFLIVFGIGDEAKIAMAFLPTFLLLLVNTSYGVRQASPERRRMAKAFGANRWQVFWTVICYEALPQIFIGLRLALAIALVVTVVSEMFIGTELGLGQRVYDSYLTNSVSTLYALLLTLGIFGYLLNKLAVFCEHKIVFWAGK